jgi:Undecaprenyl-phosphate glucose phosphotransferase
MMNPHLHYTLVSRSGANKLLRRRRLLTAETLSAAIFFADLAVIIAISVVSGIGYHALFRNEIGDILSFLQIGALAASIFIISNLFRGEYKLANFLAFQLHFRRSFQLWNVTFVCLLAVGFLTKVSVIFSRGWMVLFYASGIVTVLALRYVLVHAIRLASHNGLISTKRIFLVGTGRKIQEFIRRYEPWTLGIQIVGCRFLTPAPKDSSSAARVQILKHDLDAAIQSARYLEPEAIFILAAWSDAELIDRCVETLLTLPAEIHLGPEQVLHNFSNVQLAKLGPMSSLQLTPLPLSRLNILEKRAVDLIFSAVGLVLCTPILLLIALAIKLDSPGPVFFLQRRYGFNQEPFRIIKFRTMQALEDGPRIPQATRDDPRITRVGRFLRRWNLDEVPQLFNVLKGDMSLVGPRPHALSHNHEFERKISLYARRHNVKPGITGWAQVHGFRGETDTDHKMHKRVEYDLHYIDNWSLAFDFSILIRTVFSPSAYRNAY